MALNWIMYAEPGMRQLEAFGNGLRYNITEVSPSCWGLHIRRMDDPRAELHGVGHCLDSVQNMAESVKPENVIWPKQKEKANGNPA